MENGCCLLISCPDTTIPCFKCRFFIKCEKCDNFDYCVMGYVPPKIEILLAEE